MQDDDVLIEIHATGVNPLDTKIRSGDFKLILPYRMPLILGNDVAGVVVRIRARVSRFTPGDVVYARPDQNRIGGFAERIAIEKSSLALKPRNLDMAQAASLPLVALTAWPLKQVIPALSWRIRRQARQRSVGYDFVFMRADGEQLGEITALVERRHHQASGGQRLSAG